MEIIVDKLTNLNIPLSDLDEMRDKGRYKNNYIYIYLQLSSQ
jgi:hypothetical protein